ncbi:MAG: Dabb family protein [Bacteroidota bacterium]
MKYLPLFALLLLFSCSDPNAQQQIATLRSELDAANEIMASIKAKIEPEGNLVHLVMFKLKADADANALVAEIKKLETIEGVMDLEVGTFEDLGDERALSEYGLAMQMSFQDAAAYQKYQQDPIHLALKEATKAYLAAPPVTYDFTKR